MQLTWSHGPAALGSAPAATRFLVCLAPWSGSGSAPACTWPGQFNMTVGSLPSEPYVHPLYGPQPHIRLYRFTLPVASAPALLDRSLAWTVGACSSTATNTCGISSARQVYWSTRNLTAPDFANVNRYTTATQGSLALDLVGSSDGESDSGPFTVRFRLAEGLIDTSDRCIVDVNAAGLASSDEVIYADGTSRSLSSLTIDGSGRRLADGTVVGITRSSLASYGPVEFNDRTLYAGDSSITLVSRVSYTFPWGTSGRLVKRFIAIMNLDSGDAVREFEEADNGKGECLRAIQRG